MVPFALSHMCVITHRLAPKTHFWPHVRWNRSSVVKRPLPEKKKKGKFQNAARVTLGNECHMFMAPLLAFNTQLCC